MACIEDNLWCSVPPGDHILGERSSSFLVAPRQPKIADLEIAVLVEEEVARLEVSVNDV